MHQAMLYFAIAKDVLVTCNELESCG